MNAMLYKITNSSEIPYSLCENDRINSILQNIALILRTKRGTVPMYRDFGMPMAFIGMPLPAAEATAAQEIADALETFEPRAMLNDISLSGSPDGAMTIEVEVEI